MNYLRISTLYYLSGTPEIKFTLPTDCQRWWRGFPRWIATRLTRARLLSRWRAGPSRSQFTTLGKQPEHEASQLPNRDGGYSSPVLNFVRTCAPSPYDHIVGWKRLQTNMYIMRAQTSVLTQHLGLCRHLHCHIFLRRPFQPQTLYAPPTTKRKGRHPAPVVTTIIYRVQTVGEGTSAEAGVL